ncbi:hypothetical protein [Aliikangiella sp. G2MR2-5]|uniref:hypothetical protein n=1 Tax=Aliikangiella sp. G2MR2-5 TaxID=2788943 RepID=UPI0018ABED10|nr:hypothetical protein [Aliikangiella sp. G2MR2-5]
MLRSLLPKSHKLVSFLFLILFFSGCNIDDSGSDSGYDMASAPPADFELLFIGNSHSEVNNLPGLVVKLIETGEKDKSALSFNAPGWKFLDERVGDGVTQESIEARNWTHIILQAQKYSTSGLYSYPTDAAEMWIRQIKMRGAIPILFPEWPRKGDTEEGMRIHQLHLSISATEPACVAPVGLVWNEVIARHPDISLHDSDGNHSNPKGALLTAYVFYEVITGKEARNLPDLDGVGASAEEQSIFRNIASEVIANNPPCP